MGELIYLDNAATSYPKPRNVYESVRHCMEDYCGNPGRSGHALSLESARTVYRCREALAELFSLANPENAVFTLNTTYALNIALRALLSKEDHVLISNIEHNSVYRPILQSGCRFDIFNSFQTKEKLLCEINKRLTPKTKLIVCSHLSNLCPIKNPIKEIGRLAKRRNITFIVDAAQSAGVYPINMKESNISALCLPSHKGLYGIQGCGAVLFSEDFVGEASSRLKPLITGGNGVNSLDGAMPSLLPERLEAGTLPTPAIAGLCAGISTLNSTGIDTIRSHEQMLYKRARERLGNMRDVHLYCKEFSKGQTLLFNIRNRSSADITHALDKEGVCVRGGFHCSPLGHKLLNTGENGAVRLSFGAFNTLEEVDRFCDKLWGIINEG